MRKMKGVIITNQRENFPFHHPHPPPPPLFFYLKFLMIFPKLLHLSKLHLFFDGYS